MSLGTVKCSRSSGWNPSSGLNKASFQAVEASHLSEQSWPHLHIFLSLNSVTLESLFIWQRQTLTGQCQSKGPRNYKRHITEGCAMVYRFHIMKSRKRKAPAPSGSEQSFQGLYCWVGRAFPTESQLLGTAQKIKLCSVYLIQRHLSQTLPMDWRNLPLASCLLPSALKFLRYVQEEQETLLQKALPIWSCFFHSNTCGILEVPSNGWVSGACILHWPGEWLSRYFASSANLSFSSVQCV